MTSAIDKFSTEMIALRRHFHAHPEVAREEYKTAERIEAELDKLGIPHRRVGETGVCGFVRGGQGGGITVLRADIDGLRVPDRKGAEYSSKIDGVSHSCGHDMHTAALLGVAMALSEVRDKLTGEIRLIFQQAEEIGYGARVFIKEGLLDGVDRAVGVHAASNLPVGVVAIAPGVTNASCDFFRAEIEGKSAHVSCPEKGVDALYIAAESVVNLQAIVSRMTAPLDPVIVGVGKLNSGTVYNVIAETAVFEGTTRCFSPATRTRTNEAVARIVTQTAEMYGGKASIEFADFSPPLINDAGVCAELTEVARAIDGVTVVNEYEKSLGADDMADLINKTCGAYAYVGTRNPDDPNTCVAHHNDMFDIDERGIVIAAKLLYAYAVSRHMM